MTIARDDVRCAGSREVLCSRRPVSQRVSGANLTSVHIVIRPVYAAKPGLTAYHFPSFLGES
jgi:hypothetical protein